MNMLFLAFTVFATLFISFLICAVIGRNIGNRHRKHNKYKKMEVLTVAEGAVFALLGLLIAFTFTGAYERFEGRKTHIIDEAVAIDTVYFNIDLLAPQLQAPLKNMLKNYIDVRYFISKQLTAFNFQYDLSTEYAMRKKIWLQMLDACRITNNMAVTQILLPSVTKMFEVAEYRDSLTKIHPPYIIFGLLIGLTMLSAFLAGYSSAENENFNYIYICSYVFIMAFIIYLILDIELPRVGLININQFDQTLLDVRDSFNKE